MSIKRDRVDVATEVDDSLEPEEDFDASVLPSGSHTLAVTRLNPEAPDFVPSIANRLRASKVLGDLVGYTRWSNAANENISYGARYDSIWSERCLHLQVHAQALVQAQAQAQVFAQAQARAIEEAHAHLRALPHRRPHPKLSAIPHSKPVKKSHEQPQMQLADIIESALDRGPQQQQRQQQQPQQLPPPMSKKRPIASDQCERDPDSESGPSSRCCACTIM